MKEKSTGGQEKNNVIYKLISIIPGIALCFLVAMPSWLTGRKFPVIGGPVIAIVIGILIATLFPKLITYKFTEHIGFTQGIKYTSKKLLQYSIILLGFDMNLYNIIRVGSQSLLVMLFTLATAFIIAFIIGKALRLSGNTTTLIGVGTAICGGSAIAATAPVIHAKDEDVARAISTIFLFNIVAVFTFPALGRLMNMSDINFGMWIGTAVNDTSSVVATGTVWSNAIGDDAALRFATIVKLTRTLMIVPITLFLAIYTARKSKGDKNSNFNFAKVFPWFVLFFILAAIINTFTGIPESLSKNFVAVGKFVIVMAMAAIGLSTNLKTFISSGIKPILLGLCCWFSVAVMSLIVQSLIVLPVI